MTFSDEPTIVGDDETGSEIFSEIGPWAMVPVWVLTKGLKPATLCTYIALRSFADRAGGARPHTDKIAERAGLSVGTVRNSIQELRSKGLIRTSERRRADGSLAGLNYKMFDIDPTPGVAVQPKRKGGKPGPKPAEQNPSSATGTPTNAPPSTENENAGAGTSGNAGGVHQVMQGGAPSNAPKNTPREHTSKNTSDPAAQGRRPGAENDAETDGQPDGQIDLIDGTVKTTPEDKVKLTVAVSQQIAREWIEFRALHNCPVVVGGSGNAQAALSKNFTLPSLIAGYTAQEIKFAFMWCDTGIPSKPVFEAGLTQVRSGWRPVHGWKPGDGRDGGGIAGQPRQRRGGPNTNENRHVDNLSAQQRDDENPFNHASRQSDYVREGAVA